MLRILLLWCCALLALLEPAAAVAEAPTAATTAATSTSTTTAAEHMGLPPIHRPRYKRYKGNSRTKKHRMGPLRRWKARRKAKKKASSRRGVIKVDVPVGTMPKH